MTPRRVNKTFAKLIVLLLAFNMFFVSFSAPVYAAEGEEQSEQNSEPSPHADPATFRKNFVLPVDKKEYTITECEKVVSQILRPKMSDLEKYYTLAIWSNIHVTYDGDFWDHGYNFDFYRYQWDSYGAMKEDEKSVCVGIAIFYSNLCHAAGLPCKFVRTKPEVTEHIINYIPDINDNAYYVDITEGYFLASEKSDCSYEPDIDKEFAHITKPCTEPTFDFYFDINPELTSTNIKNCYNKTFDEWFKEYALHEDEDSDKIFDTPYEEKGSGKYGVHYADYHDHPSDFTEQPDVWFLDDFYEDPAAIKAKILDKELDEQLLDVSGIRQSYDIDSVTDLQEAVGDDISVKYFPTSENGEIVAKSAKLKKDVDYTIEYVKYDDSTKTHVFAIKGIGAYKGEYQIHVKTDSDAVYKEPVGVKDLVYIGKPQELIKEGKAVYGEMQYALGNRSEPTGEFSTELPTAVNAGHYFVWFKATGDAEHEATQPQRMENPVRIAASDLEISANITIPVGKTIDLRPEIEEDLPVNFTCMSFNEDIVSVTKEGTVTGLKAGKGRIKILAEFVEPNPNYKDYQFIVVDFTVVPDESPKEPNTITAKNLTKTYSAKEQSFDLGAKALDGTPAYKSSTKSVTVSKDGKVTVNAKYIGKATITITAPETEKYSATTRKITITVNPTKTALTSVTSPAAGKMTVKWKKNAAATGYKFQYSTSSKFTNAKTVTITKNSILDKTIGGLAKGKKYYVHILAFKKVGDTYFYSAWSDAKTVTIKK